jgi:hypothetical protein
MFQIKLAASHISNIIILSHCLWTARTPLIYTEGTICWYFYYTTLSPSWDQSLALRQRVLSVSQMVMLFTGRFSQRFRVLLVRTFPKQHPPPWCEGCSLWRPLDASKGRPSLTSYNGIVPVSLWPKLSFAKKWLRQIDRRLLRLHNLTLHMKYLHLLNAGSTTLCKYHAPFSDNLHSIFSRHSNPSYIMCCRTFISNVLSTYS